MLVAFFEVEGPKNVFEPPENKKPRQVENSRKTWFTLFRTGFSWISQLAANKTNHESVRLEPVGDHDAAPTQALERDGEPQRNLALRQEPDIPSARALPYTLALDKLGVDPADELDVARLVERGHDGDVRVCGVELHLVQREVPAALPEQLLAHF